MIIMWKNVQQMCRMRDSVRFRIKFDMSGLLVITEYILYNQP